MNKAGTTADRIAGIIDNLPLAKALSRSIRAGLKHDHVHLKGRTAWEVFEHSLDAAQRDIETHPRGELFRRLLEYGPPDPDDPETLSSDHKTTLSDPECGGCVQFIFSHMVNRFKGELAELLSIAPCLELTERLQQEHKLPAGLELYFGETIRERRRVKVEDRLCWGEFVKGADGLLAQPRGRNAIEVHGIVEVKSMPVSEARLLRQLEHHRRRLQGGACLDEVTWSAKQIVRAKKPLYIMVVPSTWKLSRQWHRKETEGGWQLLYETVPEPPAPTRFEKTSNGWTIVLDWSKEALEQAAYEMTFWYMSQVGTAIYGSRPLPKGWESMTPAQAGYNAIKMMLYYITMRYVTPRQHRRTVKLYNAYSFGYPLAADAKELIWPEDLSK